MNKIIITNETEIDEAATRVLGAIGERKIVALRGHMGAGKTTLTAAMMRALKMDDEASSPTFAIVNEYHSSETGQTVYHFDFYRLESPSEAFDIGIEDYWNSGCLLYTSDAADD